jgi:hypothetical protein
MRRLKQSVATNASGFALCDLLVRSGWLYVKYNAWNHKQKENGHA